MATLSSTYSVYLEAVQSVVALYVQRGYPQDLVYTWLRQNVRERWDKRLAETPRAAASDVLVLKSEYNTAWNFFSAKESKRIQSIVHRDVDDR